VHLAGGGLAWDVAAEPYGALKRLDELTLGAAAQAVGAAAIIPRVFNLAGPWLLKRGFAIANLIDQVRAGGPVRIEAARPVVRSYVDVEDLTALLLALAERRESATFDTAGEVEVEMGELATRVAAALGAGPVVVEREWDPAAEPSRYVGDAATLRRLAGEVGVTFRGLDEQIVRTAEIPAAGEPR
jgi:nucleoside-diphosphate-sugar epimerase